MKTNEIIDNLEVMKAEVEWEYPIDYAATIDAAVEAIRERAEGYWNYHRFSGMCFCSACGKHALYDTDCHVITSAFCPHCGVKMTTVKYGRDE